MANIIEQRKFVLSSVSVNSNKVWQYTLYDDNSVLCKWGRVGKGLQSKTFSGGKNYADKKVREKIKKGYKEVEVLGANSSSNSKAIAKGSLREIATKQIKHTDSTVVKLIEYLTDVNAHNIYEATGGKITLNTDSGLFQTPIGIVSLDNIRQARILLNNLAQSIKKQDFTSHKTVQTFEDYLMLVPQEVPRKLTVKSVIPNSKAILKQNDLLDGLETSYASAINVKPTEDNNEEDQPQIFDVSLDIVKSKEHDRIVTLFRNSRNRMHSVYGYKIINIYEVKMPSLSLKYDAVAKKINNARELWHGTKSCHLLSILKSGLKMPSAISSSYVTGALFGSGIYGSDQSTKSLQYSVGVAPGQRRSSYNRYFMFLCDFAMGKTYRPKSYYETFPPRGYDSVFAEGGKVNIGYGKLKNNEMIVYKPSQVNLKYLLEFKPN